jgi:NAD(P)-dependent dehydrogenase (short-subunit alcohol dehydrogenase family)
MMAGRRVLIAGASSGIGAAFAKRVVAAGADVTVSARRQGRLVALTHEMGSGHAVVGDATIPDDARRIAAAANESMGGIDLMVYAAGYGVLQRIEETDPDVWIDLFRVNVIGANLLTAAALRYMDRNGVCAFLSTRTVDDANALFAPYTATKAALDQCIRAWRVEHPDRRFVRVVVGNCQPTEFADRMGAGLLVEALDAWGRQCIPGGLMQVDDVGQALTRVLAMSLDHPEIDASELKLDARAE